MKKLRLEPDDWLRRALEVLRQEGIQGVRVERIARDLGVTKGSFYWHFQDLADLHRRMLVYWGECFNDVVIKRDEFRSGEPRSALLTLFKEVRCDGLDRYELAIRAWAEHDEQTAEVVRAVYKQRHDFVFQFFRRLGFSVADAEVRTQMAMCYLSWEPSLYLSGSQSKRSSVLKRMHELVTNIDV